MYTKPGYVGLVYCGHRRKFRLDQGSYLMAHYPADGRGLSVSLGTVQMSENRNGLGVVANVLSLHLGETRNFCSRA